jgi:23S rRNA (guanosine2251-2'-O)-methyltransferase
LEKIITGLHGIEEALKTGKQSGKLYISRKNSRIDIIKNLAQAAGIEAVNIPPAEMNKRYGNENRGVVLQLFTASGAERGPAMDTKSREALPDGSPSGTVFEDVIDSLTSDTALVVILDGVTDPHNYGAILRSAEQFGADLVVSRSRRSVSESDTVARTSSGAVNYVKISVVKNLSRAVDYLKTKNFWVYSAEMEGEPLYRTKLSGRTAIVMGSEGKGVSRLVSEKCDAAISIPSSGRVDSLNVSVAAGIILYEIRRQQTDI